MNSLLKIAVIIAAVTLGLYFVPNPLRNHIPSLVQVFANLRDPAGTHNPTLSEITRMQINPEYCTRNADCQLLRCGPAPNCNSYTFNKHYLEVTEPERLVCEEFECPEEFDMYVACEDNVCVTKNAFSENEDSVGVETDY